MKTKHPECDKMLAVHDESQAIGAFLDEMGSRFGYHLMQYVPCGGYEGEDDYVHTLDDCNRPDGQRMRRCSGPQLVPVGLSIERILAAYFGIDLNKVDKERRAMLEELRSS